MYLLDTDVLIWILRGKKEIVEHISALKQKADLCISSLSIAEIYKNIYPSELTMTEEFLNQHIIYSVDQKIAKTGGLYWQQYSRRLKNLSLIDCLIAGTAQVYGLSLVSLNVKHFPMNDIKIVRF